MFAENIITRALEKALSQDHTMSPFTTSEETIAVDELNDMMAELDAIGISMGYAVAIDKNSDVNLPSWSLGMVKSNLAVRLSNEFGHQITSGLLSQALSGLDMVMRRLAPDFEVAFPDTLPVGSGNNPYYTSKFFADYNSYRLQLQNGSGRSTEQGIPQTTGIINGY